MFVCLSFFNKKGIVYVLCCVAFVCVEKYHRHQNHRCGRLSQKQQPCGVFIILHSDYAIRFFRVFVCLFALKAISRRAFIKMLFCVTSVFSLHIRSCHHHLYICFFSSVFCIGNALDGMAAGSKIFPLPCVSVGFTVDFYF